MVFGNNQRCSCIALWSLFVLITLRHGHACKVASLLVIACGREYLLLVITAVRGSCHHTPPKCAVFQVSRDVSWFIFGLLLKINYRAHGQMGSGQERTGQLLGFGTINTRHENNFHLRYLLLFLVSRIGIFF